MLTEHRIKGAFAAPRHQEQNDICERAWQSVREIALKMTMVHAHVPDEFFNFALEHACWKVFNCLPIRDLQLDGKPRVPLESYTGRKPHLSRVRVFFCPCVIGMEPANQGCGPILQQNNCPSEVYEAYVLVYLATKKVGCAIYLGPVVFTSAWMSLLMRTFAQQMYTAPILKALVFQDPRGAC